MSRSVRSCELKCVGVSDFGREVYVGGGGGSSGEGLFSWSFLKELIHFFCHARAESFSSIL